MTSMTGVAGGAVPGGGGADTGASGAGPRWAGSGGAGWARLVFGAAGRPRWEQPGLIALLVVTAGVYVWGLGGAGWTNEYYAAAVQSGTQSWKALLFGSLDPQNAITVDKPPASMWVMGLSGRIFGFNSWSMLVPEALMGVAAVALLAVTVRRWAGPAAGLIAGAVLAVTPVAAMMFRYDNPDALLTLLLVAAAYCTARSVDASGPHWFSASTGWLAGAGVLMGLGFLAKMMQAFLVLPGLALVVLVAGPGGVLSRITKLATAGAALVVSAGWYVALVELWPSGSRPFIGGSTDNSLWELAVDYNGLGRILGNQGGGHPAGPAVQGGSHNPGGGQSAGSASGGNSPSGGQPSDGSQFPGSDQISGGGHLAGGQLPGGGQGPSANQVPDAGQAHGQFQGGFGGFGSKPGITRLFTGELATEFSWLLPVALIALIAGLWLTRRAPRTDRVRAGLVMWGGWLLVSAAVLSYMSRSFHSYYSIMLAPAIGALAGIGITQLLQRREHLAARITLAVMAIAAGGWTFVLLHRTPDWLPSLRWAILALAVVAAALVLILPQFRRYGLVIGLVALLSGLLGPTAYAVETVASPHSGGSPVAGPARATHFGNRSGDSDAALDDLITAADTRWAAAAVGASDVSSIELRTGAALLAVGGFSGRDEAPTLEQFQQYVADHEITYYLVRQRTQNQPNRGPGGAGAGSADPSAAEPGAGDPAADEPPAQQSAGGGYGRSGSEESTSAHITAWVKANFPETTMGTVEVYRLNG
ncbi:glycosyltransferase family 39 protein [Nocardia jejuensis]|uniref:glycosyltransferase family 39 protein n=1 Tax=Nocardia jejuensis TaxID=328049 RepID=UPI000AE4195D|nr:glycosyltransferase family 39 protein [Nocardia jejuensis]